MAALRILARGGLSVISRSGRLHDCDATWRFTSQSLRISQIQQRWSSFKSSPTYTKPEDYTDYDITNDPNEWKYVERLFKCKIIPKPPTVNELPSGYKPATALPTTYPYFIERTKNYMQPVYLEIYLRGSKRITRVSKIQGDIWALERDLKQYLEEKLKKKIYPQIHEVSGKIKFKGDCVNRIKEWMDMKGF